MTDSNFLHRYFLNNSKKRLHKWVHYFDIYERHFSRFRGKSPTILEIGVAGGGSLAMWKEYFAPGCKVVGIDINENCKQHEADDIQVFIGSQDDPLLIDEVLRQYKQIDIVLDDGSHQMRHMISTFELLYHQIDQNGVYMVEDTHTCYWKEYGSEVGHQQSFMEYCKKRIDDLNAVHTQGQLPISDFTKSTDSITFYDSIVVFEKRAQGKRQAPVTGPMTEQP